ncbi:hypothetical protein [Thalassoroseus pseudoceratinae]|uniref:hypothetical protein n=1 Tax=Thalassoroseus pseudoceratinae TaxID=2713176 RepID=UPI00141ECD3D|nr:hypothetical protein [Thalassoroseus pseudoceratinae]
MVGPNTRQQLIFAGILYIAGICGGPSVFAGVVKPLEDWKGVLRNSESRNVAPKSGFITDQKTWAKVWKAWRGTAEVPEINFTRDMVIVATVSGPNRILMAMELDAKGNLQVRSAATKIGGPGFGYALVKVLKAGVRSVNGKPLEPGDDFADATERIIVDIRGKLQHGVVVIGGETTGTTVEVDNISLELDLSANKEWSEEAGQLSGKMVRVKGRLTKKKGVEVGDRWIVEVFKFAPSWDE